MGNVLLGYWMMNRASKTFNNAKPEFTPDAGRVFNVKNLAQYDGLKSKTILVGVMGKVFDVTTAANRYGPGGSYSVLAGRDASRFLATHRLPKTDEPHNFVEDTLEDLSDTQKTALNDWLVFYEKKYPVVGVIVY